MNNYTPADVDRLSQPIAGVQYLIFGKEVAPDTGTPHLQGTVCFQSRKRLPQVVAILGQCHCSLTRHLLQSIEYCKKEGDYIEWGTVPSQPRNTGKRSDLDLFKESVKGGMYKLSELREAHSSVCAQYPRFVKEYLDDNTPQVCVEAHPLRQWQEDLNAILRRPPDPRSIIFVVDVRGNQGKSWFARYFCELHDDAQIIIPGKKADMAYVAREDARVFFFDAPRSKQGDFIQYDFLEELKNGYFFSPKYESRLKKLKTPHVVVCMNERPDMEKLSADRYHIITLT